MYYSIETGERKKKREENCIRLRKPSAKNLKQKKELFCNVQLHLVKVQCRVMGFSYFWQLFLSESILGRFFTPSYFAGFSSWSMKAVKELNGNKT